MQKPVKNEQKVATGLHPARVALETAGKVAAAFDEGFAKGQRQQRAAIAGSLCQMRDRLVRQAATLKGALDKLTGDIDRLGSAVEDLRTREPDPHVKPLPRVKRVKT